MLPNISAGEWDFLTRYSEAWHSSFGNTTIDVVPTFIPDDQINNEVLFMLQHNQAISNDGWMMDPKGFGDVVGGMGAIGLLDLTAKVTDDAALEWADVLPFVRDVHSSYAGRVYGLPVTANVNLLYYRQGGGAAAPCAVALFHSDGLQGTCCVTPSCSFSSCASDSLTVNSLTT